MYTLLLIAASLLPAPPDVLRDACDLVELNHFYDCCGRLVFDQLIFWDWSEPDSRYHVVDWRVVKSPNMLPERDFARGGYACVWVGGESVSVTRSVRAREYRESWTQYDPELLERTVLPKEKRRGLRGAR